MRRSASPKEQFAGCSGSVSVRRKPASGRKTFKPGVVAVEIDPSRPGLPQLADALRRHRNLAAIHVVSHASAGVLLLGSSRKPGVTSTDSLDGCFGGEEDSTVSNVLNTESIQLRAHGLQGLC